MRALLFLCFLAATTACSEPASSHGVEHGQAAALTVETPWAAPTPAGVDVSAGYLTIHNGSAAADRLLSVSSPRAERVEVHEMSMDGAVMRMRPVEALTVAAGERVQFGPGGKHLMFYGVSEPFREGEQIPVQLRFETAGTLDVVLPVRRGAPASHAQH